MNAKTLIGLALAWALAAVGSAIGQKIVEEQPYYLRHDKRLHVRLNLDVETPKLAHVVEKLRQATGLDLTVDEALSDHAPDFGVIQHSKAGWQAWQLMELVAQKDLQKGYWDQTERGYTLRSDVAIPPKPKPVPAPTDQLRFREWLIYLLALLFASSFVLWVARRRATRARPAG